MGRRLVEGEERDRVEAKLLGDHNKGLSPTHPQDGSYYEWTAEIAPMNSRGFARVDLCKPNLWHVTPLAD